MIQSRVKLSWTKLGILCAILLLIVLVVFFVFEPLSIVKAEAPDAPANIEVDLDDSECLVCHSQPDLFMPLPSGEMMSISLDIDDYVSSVHGGEEVGCVSCHPDHKGYPHRENPAEDIRDYVLGYKDTCKECHADLCEEQTDCVHNIALEAGNRNAAICADCHTPHSQGRVTDDEGNLLRTINREIPPTCAHCHNAVYEIYAQSVHGAGLVGGNPDVPTCIDCHQLHVIEDPTQPSFRLYSVHYCSKCHSDEEIMDKYDVSTNVESTYIADFHGTTTTLFEYDNPNEPTNKPVCYDCHGYHDVKSADDPEKGIHVKSNLLLTCQRCHPDAEENFPETWLGHYIPDSENYPWVYYVKLFYKFLIPTVLGGMGVFVVSDIIKKWSHRKKKTYL